MLIDSKSSVFRIVTKLLRWRLAAGAIGYRVGSDAEPLHRGSRLTVGSINIVGFEAKAFAVKYLAELIENY